MLEEVLVEPVSFSRESYKNLAPSGHTPKIEIERNFVSHALPPPAARRAGSNGKYKLDD